MTHDQMTSLRQDQDPIQTATTRGYLRALDAVLRLPESPDPLEQEQVGIPTPEV